MIVLDTNVIIDHLRTGNRESLLMQLAKKYPKSEIALSVISIQELYEGKSTLDANKEKLLLATVAPLQILSYTFETAKLAGEIARGLSRPIELADAAIAASAIENGAVLATLNQKDFLGINQLELYPI